MPSAAAEKGAQVNLAVRIARAVGIAALAFVAGLVLAAAGLCR